MKEYKFVGVKKSRAEEVMNQFAGEGWEVVTVTYYYGGFVVDLYITFARDVKS